MRRLYFFTLMILTTIVSIAQEQQIEVTGTVTDDKNYPLPGVSVQIKGTSTGVTTDFYGKYTLKARLDNILVFKYLGFATTERKIDSKSTVIDVILISSVATLDEVVVTGYGVAKKSYVTGSISKISTTKLRRSSRRKTKSNTSIDKKLRGRVAGVHVSRPTENIKIRGIASVNKNKDPLYIVDGKPIASKDISIVKAIDPSKIANIEVLKDINASAIYGARAGNGCVVISTHSGNFSIENSESYKEITENNFERTSASPLSTFSVDVDKASYSNVRRMINNGEKIPAAAVKIEEMVNYFDYEYEQPIGEHPFAIHTEQAVTPWNENTQLVKIGLKGKEISHQEIPASNLVFLIDVSGSMGNSNKLPLLKNAFKLLVNQLREKDKISIVVYAGAAGVVLEPTSGANKQTIIEALQNLNAGGSTAGGEGIELAYKIAKQNFIKDGNNRVILATDGDFNVGMSTDKEMKELIEEKRKSGVFLTCLGFGMGNYKDDMLETLADKGNGNHAYIDTMQEAQRILGKEFGGTLYTIAKDVKIQVEFNPSKVQAYRLIGYENRMLEDEDFIDDTKDAGELGSGHTVTALYEVIPVGVKSKYVKEVADLKYTKNKVSTLYGDELLTVKFRYKKPQKSKSIEIIHVHKNANNTVGSQDFNFAASVAWFGMKLRNSEYISNSNLDNIISLAKANKTKDDQGYRAEFLRLLNSYQGI
ncbi:VWA domain-containing protein [Aquimarina pacifica]|uniref:VWA domain-containing protein n=1 Tax=Aquimarina pacifica TaxID=1296415 RepID=UPI000472FC5B|nr:VWA domain-containing protein [Aquimarina pacifica]